MFRFKFLGKTHLPHRKSTAGMAAIRMPAPAELLFPIEQCIGSAASPVVSVGDEVKVGQLIAEATSPVSSPIYSSVSGKVFLMPMDCNALSLVDNAVMVSDAP